MDEQDVIANADKNGFERVGYDDFFEDLFGLSLRGLYSIRTLIVTPAAYFKAARRADWEDRFTPSLRLWLGLMAILIGLQFIWAADTSNYIDTVTQLPRAIVDSGIKRDGANVEALQNFDMLSAAKRINTRNLLIYPFVFILVFLLAAAIFRPWRNGENFVVSQRYVFGVIIPGSVFGLMMVCVTYFLPSHLYAPVGNIQLGLTTLIYAMTAYWGPMRDFGKDRIGMSIVMAVLLLLCVFLAQIISMLIASFPIIMEIAKL